MLDHPQVMKKLEESAEKLFINLSSEFNLAKELWTSIVKDPSFAQKITQIQTPWRIPSWQGNLQDTFSTTSLNNSSYTVFAVDGSQIYPDRHQGTSCCLISAWRVLQSQC